MVFVGGMKQPTSVVEEGSPNWKRMFKPVAVYLACVYSVVNIHLHISAYQ
jgi:hypothetical protein